MLERYLGLDIGAECVKLAELVRTNGRLSLARTWISEHHKDPGRTLLRLCEEAGWEGLWGAAATGRLAPAVKLQRLPTKVAVAEGVALRMPALGTCAVVSIGAHGFAVVELRANGVRRIKENSRCSQGTGNFLRQLVERFDLDLAEADRLCDEVADPAPLSGRCPVILKTDMTHLANKGEGKERILAGLYDAVCENVSALLPKGDMPESLLLTGGVMRSGRIRRRFEAMAGELGVRFVEADPQRALFYEAIGAAAVAARERVDLPALDELLSAGVEESFEHNPALRTALPRGQKKNYFRLCLWTRSPVT